MQIKVSGSIRMIEFKTVSKTFKRKYWYGEGKNRTYKTIRYKRKGKVRLKKPYLSGELYLTVDELLILGLIYTDGREEWVCTNRMNLEKPQSSLAKYSNGFKDNLFVVPTELAAIVE